MIEVVPRHRDLDQRALRVFLKAIDLLGGPRGLVEHRRVTWLPSLMEAAYAVILAEEGKKGPDEIARFLGLSRAAVRHMLTASPQAALERLEAGPAHDLHRRTHVAGALARRAWHELAREESAGPEGRPAAF